MLTPERQELILQMLQEQRNVSIPEFSEAANASVSTIRRDLIELEKKQLLTRVHGGATITSSLSYEMSYTEKETHNKTGKQEIAAFAASLVGENDCIFLDAGTTANAMIPYLTGKNVTVVTNGLTHLEALYEKDLTVYVTGGLVKDKTRTLIGRGALAALSQYRFDKCFLGTNGVHMHNGYTTPDPEEASIKRQAMLRSNETFILADSSKLGQTTFAHIADLSEATLIVDSINAKLQAAYEKLTSLKVVDS
ncbi:DeoR/GlpR family DNA-binding transcription regulator [Terribacillus halophilus]|jgi:DeoR family transcriptional regulator, fructose operon transcriptional repressor|uniref:DeoR/GlpR family DNA-binding transcription regulator n=1 Tax=Terribacillus halophilus TaxID=361279 RepID=UPI0009859006|nr:DeoR/GlpR family DNA-binding transcription regulator [Terribacillus halophilus]